MTTRIQTNPTASQMVKVWVVKAPDMRTGGQSTCYLNTQGEYTYGPCLMVEDEANHVAMLYASGGARSIPYGYMDGRTVTGFDGGDGIG